MKLFDWGILLLRWNLGIIVASFLFSLLYRLWVGEKIRVTAKAVLRIGYFTIALAFFLPLLFKPTLRHGVLPPMVQVFSSIKNPSHIVLSPSRALGLGGTQPVSMEPIHLKIVALAFILLGFALMIRIAIQVVKLKGILSKAILVKRRGAVRILVCDAINTPFSFAFLRSVFVVLPAYLVGERDSFYRALSHELHHIRSRDTLFIWLLEMVKTLFFYNPFLHFFTKRLIEVQEFACDESVCGHNQDSKLAYVRCLFEVANQATQPKVILVGTTGMALSSSAQLLKRRIQMVLNQKSKNPAFIGAALTLGTGLLMAASAFATGNLVNQKIYTVAEAEVLMKEASSKTEIPLSMNPLVLRELNRYLGTIEGKTFLKAALSRMPAYQGMIRSRIEQYGHPLDLIVIPLGESGFLNSTNKISAGIWQFIPSTARRYNLIVDSEKDERLDVEKETVAAMEYLKDLYRQFKDWRFALKAYNEGEHRVWSLIKKYQTLEPWEIESQEEGGDRYLAKMTALLIILKNPKLLE